MSFGATLNVLLMTLLFMVPGYIFCKCRKLDPEKLPALSVTLLYITAPCLFMDTLMNLEYSPELTGQMGVFALVSLGAMVAFMGLLALVFRRHKEKPFLRLLSVASVMGNVAFFGLPIVRATLPPEAAAEAGAYSCIYCATMNIIGWTAGAFRLTGDKRYISLRAATVNPTVISVAAGFLMYLFRLGSRIPPVLGSCISTLGKMTTPLCMIILGCRLATMDLKELFGTPASYLICLNKLLLFPLFGWAVSLLLPVTPVFRVSILILSATPCASVILNLAEIFRSERKLAADCALLSALLSILTIPLLTLLL